MSLLEIEILSRDPRPNADAYLAEVTKIIRTIRVIEPNHKVLMHHIHRIKDRSISHALKALKLYLTHRLTLDDNQQRTEEAIVTYLWIATSEDNGQSFMSAQELRSDLDSFHGTWKRSLSPETAHAILLLIWRQIDKVIQDNGQDQTAAWCNLALQPTLAQAGDKNVGKIQRKLIACYMSIPDCRGARSVISQMSDGVKNQPLSLFLAYSISLRCKDEPASEKALTQIAKIRDKNNRLLLACVGETMKYGSKRQGAKLLQRVLDKFNYELPEDMDTCVMLRCTARLVISILAEEKKPDAEMLSRLCTIFRSAANYSVKRNSSPGQISTGCPLQECRWFERNAYNIALEYVQDWPAKAIIDLVAYSDQIEYPRPQASGAELSKLQHRITTTYIQCVLYITEARKCESTWTIEDIPRTSYSSIERPDSDHLRQHLYQNAFTQFSRLKQMYETESRTGVDSQADMLQDLWKKVVELLPLAFEALLCLSSAEAATNFRFDQMD